MDFRIKEARERAGYSQKDLADIIGVAPSTLNGYESGKHDPKSDLLVKIAVACNVTIDYLLCHDDKKTKKASPISDEAMAIAKGFDALDAHGREMLTMTLECERKRIEAALAEKNKQADPEKPKMKVIPLLGNSFAAGRGDPDFGNPWEDFEVPADSKAEFAIHINGDSMEPYLHDGDIAYGVKRAPRDGEVAALLLDGEFLCKQVCQDYVGNLYLFALNRNRKDADQKIMHNEERSISCFGTIIMDHVALPKDV